MIEKGRIVITVDGLAGSGKTSLSKLLAQRLTFLHFNSGLLYRAVGWLALTSEVSYEDVSALERLIKAHRIELRATPERSSQLLIDGKALGIELHSPEVSEATSCTSQHAPVRALLLSAQRDAFPGERIVAEGRDMGTVVFPDAPLKFFVVADEEVRTQRRLKQLHGDPSKLSPQARNSLKRDVQIEIVERDKRDVERSVAPTVAATDAVIIDNSLVSLTEAADSMYSAARSRGLI